MNAPYYPCNCTKPPFRDDLLIQAKHKTCTIENTLPEHARIIIPNKDMIFLGNHWYKIGMLKFYCYEKLYFHNIPDDVYVLERINYGGIFKWIKFCDIKNRYENDAANVGRFWAPVE